MGEIDWPAVSPDRFEHLIASLLGKLNFKNIEVFDGPGDRGRDVLCTITRAGPIPGTETTEKWIIECKIRSAATVTPSDLLGSVAWVTAHRPDVYLLVTNARVTNDTRDWIAKRFEFLPTSYQQIAGFALEDLLKRHCPEELMQLPTTDAGSAIPILDETQHAVFALFAELTSHPGPAAISELARRLDVFRDEFGNLPPGAELLVLEEKHLVEYSASGYPRRTQHCTVVNLNHAEFSTESFRLYGDEQTAYDKLNIAGDALDRHRPTTKHFDNGYLILLDAHLDQPLPFGASGSYGVSYDWPVPLPLTGGRYYTTYGRRPKKRVILQVTVPPGFWLDSYALLSGMRGVMKREYTSSQELRTREITATHENLRYEEQLQLTFVTREAK